MNLKELQAAAHTAAKVENGADPILAKLDELLLRLDALEDVVNDLDEHVREALAITDDDYPHWGRS